MLLRLPELRAKQRRFLLALTLGFAASALVVCGCTALKSFVLTAEQSLNKTMESGASTVTNALDTVVAPIK